MSGRFSEGRREQPATATAHGLLAAADKAKLDLLYQALPSCRVYRNTSQAMASGVSLAVAFNLERFDTHGFHDTAVNTSRLTVPAGLGGLYDIAVHAAWDAVGGGARRVFWVQLNGATNIGGYEPGNPPLAGSSFVIASFSTRYRLVPGDYVEVVAFQNSGGAVNIVAFPNYSPEFGLVRLGD